MQTLKLKHPIPVRDKMLEELKFRDYATAGDLLAFDERGANRQTITLIANLSGNDPELIEKLHVTDYHAADTITSLLIKPEGTEKNGQES
jgi:hypothetical protein